MTTSQIRVRGVSQLVATVPHQLGYVPEDSLVLILLGELRPPSAGARPSAAVELVCRLDLPVDAGSHAAVMTLVRQTIHREKPAMVYLLAYESGPDSTGALVQAREVCESEGASVASAVRVRGDRILEVTDGDVGEEVWRELPAPDRVPAVADLVLHGRQPGPPRSELAARVRGEESASRRVLLAELDDYADRFLEALQTEPLGGGEPSPDVPSRARRRFVERGALAWRRMLDHTRGGPAVCDLPMAVVAQGLTMLWDRGFRDALIAWVAPGQLGPGVLPADVLSAFVRHLPLSRLGDLRRLDRLVEVCSLVPDEAAAPVLTVTAQSAWTMNNGTLANLAIDRALEADPEYYLARLTEQLLVHGVRPRGGPFAAVA
jgi:hypothetical protein